MLQGVLEVFPTLGALGEDGCHGGCQVAQGVCGGFQVILTTVHLTVPECGDQSIDQFLCLAAGFHIVGHIVYFRFAVQHGMDYDRTTEGGKWSVDC